MEKPNFDQTRLRCFYCDIANDGEILLEIVLVYESLLLPYRAHLACLQKADAS
jgi:hypothetical protein